MVGAGDCKVATVEVEASAASDNTATLPVTRPLNPQNVAIPPNSQDNAEKNNAANKEMELKNVRSTPAKKTSLFIIMSFIYAKILVVVCIAYVISEVVTHRLPLYYYEGFFTYLYGASILFLLYVFCFLLQESACCSRTNDAPLPPPRPPKPPKETKDKSKKKDKKDNKKEKSESKTAKSKKEFQDAADVEAGVATRVLRRRKTSQNDQSCGSFFLRIGAIAFGLGTMVYNGLEFGTFFEVPPFSPCFQILQGINPVLQMIFTFMQMYFIFMNSRLNIHRFKVIARFGLMHVVATNLCVWIRTLVLECLKEITQYQVRMGAEETGILESIKEHTLRNAGPILGLQPRGVAQLRKAPVYTSKIRSPNELASLSMRSLPTALPTLGRYVRTTARAVARAVTSPRTTSTTHATSTSSSPAPYIPSAAYENSPPSWATTTTTMATTAAAATASSTLNSISTSSVTTPNLLLSSLMPNKNFTTYTTAAVSTSANPEGIFNATTASTTMAAAVSTVPSTISQFFSNLMESKKDDQWLGQVTNITSENSNGDEWNRYGFGAFAEALSAISSTPENLMTNSCGRVNIMGTIVQDAAPFLFPFIIEYSLIGAAVIYVMWKHIGRHPRWPNQAEADLERRLEAMLSRRAVALAHAGHGRVDCVGASKGLFFGLLLLVGSLICLILFFVLIHHPDFGLLAIYLADVSHCVLMGLSIIAIIIGFIRVQSLKFKAEDQSDLNDILLRVSAFGLFIYAVFSVIAGSLAYKREPNLLVMVTGSLAVTQVLLQLLFIADVSRRRVHLPEHDRSKPGRQIVTFLLICNVTMWVIYTFEAQKVAANPVQLDFYGFLMWSIIQRVTLPLCIFHRFHSAVTLAEIWKSSYKARLE